MHPNRVHLKQWLRNNYSEYADQILNKKNNGWQINRACTPVFEAEWLKSIKIIQDAAYKVWEDLKQIKDVNPLEIRLEFDS